jgi:hypothetical protein
VLFESKEFCQSSREYRVTCCRDIVILLLLYRKERTIAFVWSSRGRVKVIGIMTEVRVTLVGIRTEVSRHFKEIIALDFGTCRLGCPTAPGDLKGMINKFNIALGQTQRRLHTKWWTKNISRSRWISNHSALLRSAPRTCKAGSRIEINAKARENRFTILK